MIEILTILAKNMSEEGLLEKIEEAIAAKKSAITEEEQDEADAKLAMSCTMGTIRWMSKDRTTEELLETHEEARELKKFKDSMENLTKN